MRDNQRGIQFRQVPLSEDHLLMGLMLIENVDFPQEPIAMTGVPATDLERTTGISFQKSFDDLGEGYFAILDFAGSFRVTLKDCLSWVRLF